MSEAAAEAGAVAPAQTQSVQQQPAAPALQVTQPSDAEPAWLPDRLKRAEENARKALLADLGVADAKDAKSALKAYKEAQESQKTEQQKLSDRLKSLEPLESEVASLKSVVTDMAKTAMDGLTERQREAIADIAGDDPRAQLKAISTMRAKGLLKADPAAPLPAPANTTKSPSAPNPSSPTQPDHVAAWQELQTKNPIKAAAYRIQHAASINAAIAARK